MAILDNIASEALKCQINRTLAKYANGLLHKCRGGVALLPASVPEGEELDVAGHVGVALATHEEECGPLDGRAEDVRASARDWLRNGHVLSI